MPVSFLDLKAINQRFKHNLITKFADVLDSGWYINGEACEGFEAQFAKYCGVSSVVGVGNGLDALILSMRALNLEKGSEVLVPANTYIASILAVSAAGYKPIFVEPDINTYNINLAALESKITNKTKAILPVHLYGRAVDMTALMAIANNHGLKVVEDVAQAHGAIWEGNRVGSFGDLNAFSFYPGKNLGALGDGGAVTSNNSQLCKSVRTLANYGSEKKYVNEVKGVNSRLDELQAKILSEKLMLLDSDNNARRSVAKSYLKNIKNPQLVLPQDAGLAHVWHLFVVRCGDRDRFKMHLDKYGIGNLIHYPIPPHKQKAYVEERSLRLEVTEKIHSEVISLPISPVMDKNQVHEVIDVVNSFE